MTLDGAVPAAFSQELDGVLGGSIPFGFHFQPIVDLEQGTAVGYECLARFAGRFNWSPDRWFNAAEACGRGLELEALVAEKAMAARAELPANCFLSMNVGPQLLLSDRWDELLHPVPSLGGIVVEVTEQQPIGDYAAVQSKLANIRRKGGSVAVDDLGSGYASLKHLMEMRPDFVKLDRAFISGCQWDPVRAALIELIGTTAGRLDAWIVAEGVEERGELDELIALGVGLGQGYFLGKPAAEMRAVHQDTRSLVQNAARTYAQGGKLTRALEQCSVHAIASDGMRHLQRAAQALHAVVVDEWGRPTVLVEKHPLLGLRTLDSFLKAQIDSEVTELLHRALARSSACRFDPIVAINARGEFQGVIRMERLIAEALPRPAERSQRRGSIQPISQA